ncbi:animal heme peroxidase family protein [Lyngbya aestuarii BL J]|uniref:Animal heme peroxidase family protein n=2 Tax=Lyngbya aestuarii BL J TaxID=1348334 RepID=U7QE02_9CYAN|nr:heme peroxidase family protein [Lyngbya aestuarii]ERT05265.1 animal heme peroxidase family protein [Lyngbya aestuarii BL J]
MLKNISHAGGVNPQAKERREQTEEILFSTPFGYMFPDLVMGENTEANKLPVASNTVPALKMLGDAMADLGEAGAEMKKFNSTIPSVFTYLGQFVDHDITARTDRETEISMISIGDNANDELKPIDPQIILNKLKNGRRPQLDLDSLYGDGPALIPGGKVGANTEAQFLYEDESLLLKVQDLGKFVDLPRADRKAKIADMRNDENVIISQLHAAFLKFHNVIACTLPKHLSPQSRYIYARQFVRWCYQYVVINDYLRAVCDPNIVDDILLNGPRFYLPGFSGNSVFMPLEFSVAGFRFGHSMIRPFYQLNRQSQVKIMNLLGVSKDRPQESDLLEKNGDNYQLKKSFSVDWENFVRFVPDEPIPNVARKIDPKISQGLFDLQLDGVRANTFMSHLAQRNLVRGYSLSLPTGQKMAKAFGFQPLTKEDLIDKEPNEKLKQALEYGNFGDRTPLWYYILKEAALQTGGNTLGAVGSSIVAETLIGLVKQDPNSYLNHLHNPAVRPNGIRIPRLYGRASIINSIGDILSCAGVR